jgi:hypothetical protein
MKVILLNYYKLRYDLRKIRPCEGSSNRFSSKPFFHLICRTHLKKGPTTPSKSCVSVSLSLCVWREKLSYSLSLSLSMCAYVWKGTYILHAKQWLCWDIETKKVFKIVVQFCINSTSSTFHVFCFQFRFSNLTVVSFWHHSLSLCFVSYALKMLDFFFLDLITIWDLIKFSFFVQQ